MNRNRTVIFAVVLLVGLIFLNEGCVPKKYVVKIDDQAAQLQKSQEQIAGLQKSNEGLAVDLKETKTALDQAKADDQKASDQIASLNNQVSAEKSRNEELVKSAEAANKDADVKIRRLNGQIYTLRKQQAEKEEQIAIKDNEINSLRGTQATLEETVSARDQQISKLNGEKTALAEEMDKRLSGKNTFITILFILLGLALILAIYALVRKKKQP